MLNKLKKVFGFGNDDSDELIADDPELQTPEKSPFETARSVSTNVSTEDIENTSRRIFNYVVTEFNKALPSFLANSVDPERQKELLYKGMNADLKSHLEALETDVNSRMDQAWRAEREKLQADLKNISDTAKDIEAKRAELKLQQLSSDRQRRALTERVRELEKQILGLEADKEQLELETKSMLNKVKVAQVYEKDCQALREQIADLQARLNRQRMGDISGNIQNDDESAPKIPIEELERLKNADARNVELQKIIDEELPRLREIEAEYNAIADKMSSVEEKMAKVDEITSVKDKKIGTLTDEIAQLKRALDESKKVNEETEARLERLRKERDEAIKAASDAEQQSVKQTGGQPRRIALPDDDDILTDTDWIVKPGGPRQKSSANNDQRPKTKKHTPRDDGQMSLW